ncbi:nitrous oxide reductase accessory protein NosL [Aquincola sp. S2]|uniref:Nitrous oxide reductase accessory protein NosL n=1 Tax=Pseudaquabacterium terrae TaxID=2732868 RepID=A0ABX2EQZ0_9BURK|nr:nitrous oxide reductase accessory protein NosL [Aquabacterium terrae]NRF70957.1 nitrous oxide reductase accessory protein NosL [Aquabacterium terrae]
MNTLHRRHLLLAGCAAVLAGCGQAAGEIAAMPKPVDGATACDLDGMLLADYPGPKAQVHYAGAATPVFFCDTVELFSTLLRPEQVRAVRAAYVQDMALADWDQPAGHWFDAKAGLYVVGSRRHGSMGPTFASFAALDPAQQFAAKWGGKVLRYADIKPEMADLSGGARHDVKM